MISQPKQFISLFTQCKYFCYSNLKIVWSLIIYEKLPLAICVNVSVLSKKKFIKEEIINWSIVNMIRIIRFSEIARRLERTEGIKKFGKTALQIILCSPLTYISISIRIIKLFQTLKNSKGSEIQHMIVSLICGVFL